MASRMITVSLLVLAFALAGCGGGDDQATSTAAMANQQAAAASEQPMPQAPTGTLTGKVVETMNAANYTYVQVDADGQKIWAAGPQTEVKVGDTVSVSTQMPMANFHSDALDRTFDVLYFVGGFGNNAPAGMGGMGAMGAGEHPKGEPAADLDLTGIARVDGGHTVAEVYAKSGELVGKPVRVQGKVVKYLSGIMGRNWVHLRDGSGASGTNDLTVTTDAFAKVGDLVVIEGTLATNKDFGAGYRYDVIVENATVTKK
ncbi:MAG: hypothetical protein R3D98_05685 [Candidatus Krumholzibacteriia bacterium]